MMEEDDDGKRRIKRIGNIWKIFNVLGGFVYGYGCFNWEIFVSCFSNFREIWVLLSIYFNSNFNLVDDLFDDVENRFY